MSNVARSIESLRRARATLHVLKSADSLAKLVEPRLFKRVRLGTALWHTLVVAKRPLTADEITSILARGELASPDLGLSVARGLRYHAKVGRVRYAGHYRWEINIR